jgi:hypothetical protein
MLVMPPEAKRISSRMTAFNKYVFPVIWFGFLGIFVLVGITGTLSKPATMFPFLIMPLFMAGFGYLIMKKLVWDLMDEVWDNGKELLVVNAGHVEHVPLTSIINIGYSKLSNPKRATLRLRQAGRWGEKLAFLPAWHGSSLLLMDNPVLEDLIGRVDAARQSNT